MVVTRKHDGSPHRTVDLSPLNKFCQRETFATESPFHLARCIPGDTWKTVTDSWNGYHSVPLRVSDRCLTTFITPFGRWRYAGNRKVSCHLGTATTVVLTLSSRTSSAKNAVWMTLSTMTLT